MSTSASGRPRRDFGRGGGVGGRIHFALYVVSLFAVVEVGLRTTRLPTLCRRLHITLGSMSPASPTSYAGGARGGVTPAHALRCSRAVLRVSERWPLGDTCLRRCLVLGTMLRRTGPVLVLGVRRDDTGAVVAHSWLEIHGRAIDPMAEHYRDLRVA